MKSATCSGDSTKSGDIITLFSYPSDKALSLYSNYRFTCRNDRSGLLNGLQSLASF